MTPLQTKRSLLQATRDAIDLTGVLQAALVADDLAACQPVLESRADAMVRFEDSFREAAEAERLACRELIVELKRRDRVLQETAAEAFSAVQEEMRRQFGAGTGQTSAYAAAAAPAGPGRQA